MGGFELADVDLDEKPCQVTIIVWMPESLIKELQTSYTRLPAIPVFVSHNALGDVKSHLKRKAKQ